MILDHPRSRRHRYLWPTVLTLVVLAGLGLARINERAAAAVQYLEGIRQSTESLVTPAASFIGLGERVGTVDRAEFFTVTTTIDEALEEAALTVAGSPDSQELVGVASLYRVTVNTWRSGIAMFAEGVIELAEGTPSGANRLYVGLQQVAAGDRLYAELIEESSRDDVPNPITPLPEMAFLDPGLGPGSLARLFTVAATASNSLLALRADLAVLQVSSNPEWVANTEGVLVVRETDLITINVVVANNGNAPAPAQSIDLQLVSPESTVVRNVEVPELDPGAQTTVTITELAVTPGASYQVAADLVLNVTDSDPTNNSRNLAFIVNERTE